MVYIIFQKAGNKLRIMNEMQAVCIMNKMQAYSKYELWHLMESPPFGT